MGTLGYSQDGAYLEASHARQDALDASLQYGTPVSVIFRGESDVSRDTLGTIKKRNASPLLNMNAFPVERQPDTRKLEKAGIRETVDVVIYTPIQAWIDSGRVTDERIGDTFASIDTTRSTVVLDGSEWKIADKGLAVRIGQYPVYITLGLRRN